MRSKFYRSATATTANSKSVMSKQYYPHPYPANHYALKTPSLGDPFCISILDVSGIRISVLFNPTDSRGYRLLLALVAEDMKTTFNRPFTDEEEGALHTAMSFMGSVYSGLGMTVTTATAGNNTQSLTPNGTIMMGNEHEPSLLHGHIMGRGDPNRCYLASVPLRGPAAGIEFNMRGQSQEPGNDKKIKWDPDELKQAKEAVLEAIVQKLEQSSYYHQHIQFESSQPSCELRSRL